MSRDRKELSEGPYIIQGDARSLPLPDGSVDLIVTSPPYFAVRSYQDGGAHYDGQVGAEPTPLGFLESLWECTREMMRVLKPTGSIFVNLGDKYAGSGGHNNSNISALHQNYGRQTDRDKASNDEHPRSSRRQAPDRYNKASIGGARAKSLMGLPWRYALGCVDDLGLILRAELIWAKPNGLPESVNDRVARRHEQWFHFTKEPKYFAALDDIRTPHAASSVQRAQPHQAAPWQHDYPGQHSGRQDQMLHPRGALPGSWWTIATEPLRVPKELGVDHFAAFPTEWPRRLILGWSPPAGTVLDPFGGTGTTALVAKTLGRVGISVDLSHDYCELARWRCNQSGHGTKALARTWSERQGGMAV